jgi:putative tricarboxylic transport membrane protein
MNVGPQQKSGREPHPAGGIVLLAIGIAVAVGALRYEFGSFENPGAGFVPFFAGLAIAGFSAITIVQTLKRGWSPMGDMWQGVSWQRPAIASVILIVYSVFLGDLGFLISTTFLMLYLFRVLQPSSWKETVVAALATTLVFYLVFQICLEAQLPRGWLGF